jgi:hypothetical protein
MWNRIDIFRNCPVRRGGSLFALPILLVCSCGGSESTPNTVPGNFTVQLDPENVVLTTSQRSAFGFDYGPPDGTLGVLLDGNTYTFFASAHSSATCAGTPSAQGTYRLGGTLSALTAPYPCAASIQSSGAGDPDPNGYTFDRDYAGGGPVLAVTSGTSNALVHIYHGEWYGGTCKVSGTCFYSSLGMAVSTDGGATFSKLGEILQPYVTRSESINAGTNLDVGGGTLIVADGGGQHIANVAATNPADVYLYVFYVDRDPSSASSAPCSMFPCLALARALLSDVVNAAVGQDTAVFPALFKKYWQGAFSEPGTSGDANAASNSGHYTPIVEEAGSYPTVIFDASTQQYVMAYTTGNNAVVLRHGPSLLSWSAPVDSAAIANTGGSILYPTLVGEGSDPATGEGDPWLVYVRAPKWPDWPDAKVVNRHAHLGFQ